MKYSLKQHILGVNSEEYEVVKNHVPEKEDDLTEQKAEFVDTKQKSSGLFSAVIAQLVENNIKEQEQKAPANRDRDIEFQATMGRLNKSTADDDNASTPGIKRMKQRYKRFKRKTWGDEEEEQATAMTDRDKQKMAIGWVKDLPPNISKRRGQQSGNRTLRRMTGKSAGYDEEEEVNDKDTRHTERAKEVLGNKQYDYFRILPSERGGFTVKGYGTWGRGSLEGQVKISYVDSFKDSEQELMHELYPDAEFSNKFTEPQNTFDHLSGEEEEQRVPSRMNYKFDDKPAPSGARKQQRVRGGRTARTDRVVNNNLMRKKDEFVRVDNAFKEGAVGDIFAAAFGMINEMGTAGYTERTMRTTDDVVSQLEQVLSDNGIDGAISESEKELIELETVHSPNDGGFNATLFDILSRRIQGDYSWEEKDAMVRLKNEISQQANPDSGMDNPSQDYGTRAEAPALDYEERNDSIK